ncbi:claudin-1 [Electrophorus electricus]|uniref:claudin-1 n=1 Tax=Electrophorus electricus TaxID=8005 RepID=UPI000F0A5515|nr:claudin-1 [Electrophorus electricus]
MANTAVQLFGCILSYVGCFGLIASTIMTDWKTLARASGDSLPQQYVGLWKKCTEVATGQVTCKHFSSIFFQTQQTNISRGVMITSNILCALASLVAIFGLKCTRCLDTNKQVKSMLATIAGALFILGGLCAFGIISWYAHKVTQEFQTDIIKYEFGNALFVGWSGALICVTGGAILCVCSRTHKQHRANTAKAPISKESGRQYV